MIYIFVRYVVSAIVFVAALISNYPDIVRPIAAVVLLNSVTTAVVSSSRRKVNLRFQKHIYKIYKYLHNQISSGVKPTDAVRTVYETTDDRDIREVLIRVAARYELTMDIDSALEELRSNFDTHEAETLCLALKQGCRRATTGICLKSRKTSCSRNISIIYRLRPTAAGTGALQQQPFSLP